MGKKLSKQMIQQIVINATRSKRNEKPPDVSGAFLFLKLLKVANQTSPKRSLIGPDLSIGLYGKKRYNVADFLE